jgi:signal transduction histidine kinase
VISTVIIAVASFVTYTAEQSFLKKRVDEVKASDIALATEIATAIISTKQYLLAAYSEELTKDGNIAKTFLKSQTSRKSLETLVKKTKTDVIDIISLVDGKALFHPELNLPHPATLELKTSAQLINISGRQSLVTYSPLRLYDDIIGIFVLGFDLNGSIANEISRATKANVRFLSAGQHPMSIQIAVPDVAGRASMFMEDHTPGGTHDGFQYELLITILPIVVVGLLLYLFISIGFLKYLREVLADIGRATADVKEGVVRQTSRRKYPIKEIAGLSQSFSELLTALSLFRERVREKTKTETAGEKALQVAHDVGGPLAALEMTLQTDGVITGVGEKKETILGLVNRIRKVVSVVSEENLSVLSSETLSIVEVTKVISEIFEEKKIQYGDRGIEFIRLETSDALYACLQVSEFQRVLSNIVDNSVQSISGTGTVWVSAVASKDAIEIEIIDTGCGIPSNLMSRIGERGASFGKKEGSGLGIWHAKQVLKNWQATLTFESTENEGTIARISLSRFIIPKLCIEPNSKVIVLDDESSGHQIWKERLKGFTNITLIHFERVEPFIQWFRESRQSGDKYVYLFDYELSDPKWNGLSLFEYLGISAGGFLVSAREPNKKLLEECQRIGISFIPKSLAHGEEQRA